MKQLSAWTLVLLLTPFTAESAQPAKKEALPKQAASIRAEIDPISGKLVSPPSRESAPAPSVASPGPGRRLYREESSPVPGGGRLVDLSGDFMFAVVAVVEPGGTVSTHCEPAAAPPLKSQTPLQGKEASRVK